MKGRLAYIVIPVRSRHRDALRIFSKFVRYNPKTKCLEWIGTLRGKGYGQMLVMPHRWAYEEFVGPIGDGLHIDHLCRNRRCVNPDHLEPVTRHENIRRSGVWTRTHCKRGHPFTPENLVRTGKRKVKRCKTCASQWYKAWYQEQREAGLHLLTRNGKAMWLPADQRQSSHNGWGTTRHKRVKK